MTLLQADVLDGMIADALEEGDIVRAKHILYSGSEFFEPEDFNKLEKLIRCHEEETVSS